MVQIGTIIIIVKLYISKANVELNVDARNAKERDE
jgi:hypothetical protein